MAAPIAPSPPIMEPPKKPFWVPWFWEAPSWELEEQLEHYRDLSWFRSYKKISALFLGFQVLLGIVLAAIGIPGQPSMAVAAAGGIPYVVLSLLVLRGSVRACELTMFLWTLDRLSVLLLTFYNPLSWLLNLPWWMFYMQYFWKAYTVERIRMAAKRGGAPAIQAPKP